MTPGRLGCHMSKPHSHHHEPKDYNRAFAIGIGLNLFFVGVEVIYGVISGSLALIADAGHNFSDVISLVLAWGAAFLAAQRPTKRLTYGFRRVTILASLVSAVLLLVVLGAIAWEAFQRFSEPKTVKGTTVIVVAGIGVVINTLTALLFFSGQKRDLNIKAAYLHMAADAGVSLGVVIAGVAIIATGWLWLDPLISLVIVVIILLGTWGLLSDSARLSIDSVPSNIDPDEVEAYLRGLPDVLRLHDLHIWAISTTETALTVHLVVQKKEISNEFLDEVSRELHDRFGIEHPTIQIERETGPESCKLDRPQCL